MVKDFYEVLGVQPLDDLVIIKRRYRQLVRQYHPDIAANRDAAHEMMLAINEAWTILSDPAERARYDRSRGTAAIPTPAAPAAEPSRTKVDGWVGGASTRGNAATRPAAAPPRPARGSSTTRTRLLTMVFEAAELYFFQGRAAEAIEVCRKVMKYDGNNAEAPALLGDIFSEQGKKDDAVAMYELAVRNQPNNMLYQQKLAALKGVVAPRSGQTGPGEAKSKGKSGFGGGFSSGNLSGGYGLGGGAPGAGVREETVSRAGRKKMAAAAKSARRASASSSYGAAASSYGDAAFNYGENDGKRTMAGFIAIAAALGAVWWGMTAQAGTLAFASTSSFSLELLLASILGAFFIGLALPLLGVVGGCGRVGRGEPSWMGTPFVIALAVAGAIISPAALGLFIIVSLIRKSWNASTFTVLLVAAVWSIVLSSKSVPTGLSQGDLVKEALLVWSGRGILPPMLLGWYLGSRGSR